MIDEKFLTDDQKKKVKCMQDFLQFLNKYSGNYILKGGTALFLHYGLSRFSEDIDLDSNDPYSICPILDRFCKQHGYTYNVKKDSYYTLRFMVIYAEENKPLKIEVSFRNPEFSDDAYVIDNNVRVYTIRELAKKKIGAYRDRDRIRDLFDCAFIINNYYDKLGFTIVDDYTDAFQRKGLDQLDYLIETQEDPLVDTDSLIDSFLKANDKLGLLEIDKKISEALHKNEDMFNSSLNLKEPISMDIEHSSKSTNNNSKKKVKPKLRD